MSLIVRCCLGIGLTVSLFAGLGCSQGPNYQFGQVQGVVLIQGKPGDKLRVEFHPDAEKGTKGPSSTAETDDPRSIHLNVRLQQPLRQRRCSRLAPRGVARPSPGRVGDGPRPPDTHRPRVQHALDDPPAFAGRRGNAKSHD